MPSLIAWLDASAEEQRRMREIIRLFSDRDSRDELGLGQIRDAIGDGLFPGTSTLLTRARYLLFVPWCLQKASHDSDPVAKADRYERQLIEAVRDTSDAAGLLGMRAGAALKNLPSAIYWSMLRHYRVLHDPALSRTDAVRLPKLARAIDDIDGESGERLQVWSPTMPSAPEGFPRVADGGFALTHDEAAWLRDRILDAAPDTLMSHLAVHAPDPESPAPWADPAALSVTGTARELLDHARSFSSVMHGAQLLYNLILAEQYESAGLHRIADPVAVYRDLLGRWAQTLPAVVDAKTWDLDDLLRRVERQRGVTLNVGSRRFVEDWARMVQESDPVALVHDERARNFIAARERRHKGAQARIGNRARLASWGGVSGSGALLFRWGTVRGLLTDIHEGLAR